MKSVTAAEANRQFSRLLREVARGETVIVTSRGQPVAQMTPVDDAERAGKAAALEAFLAFCRSQPRRTIPAWTREDLYEDEPYPTETSR